MPMPKTSMNKHDFSKPRKDEIGRPRQFSHMKTVAEAHGVHQSPNEHLRAGIATSDQ
jgi:hypothetical protein